MTITILTINISVRLFQINQTSVLIKHEFQIELYQCKINLNGGG